MGAGHYVDPKSRTGLNFFHAFFHHCSGSVHYCEDRYYIHVFIRSSNICLLYIHSRLFTTLRVYFIQHND